MPGEETIKKVRDRVIDRYKWGDPKTLQTCSSFVESGKSSQDLKGGWWHRACYEQFVNANRYKRAKDRFEKAQTLSKTFC